MINLIIVKDNIRVKIINKYIVTFILFTIIGLVHINFYIKAEDFFKVCIKYSWFISSILSISILAKIDDISKNLKAFYKIFFIILLFDVILSIFLNGNIYLPNEGIKLTLFYSDTMKFISLSSIPFYIFFGLKYWLLAFFILFLCLLGTRAEFLAALSSISLSIYFYYKYKIGNHFLKKIKGWTFVMFIVVCSTFMVLSVRTNSFTSSSSMVARILIWGNYISLLQSFPFGTGPQGAYYLLRTNGFNSELSQKLSFLIELDEKIDLTKRERILGNEKKGRSSESIFITFIVSFGIMGIVFIPYILLKISVTLFKLFAKGYIPNTFIANFISMLSMLIYGLLNSFYNGSFILIFMVIIFMNNDKIKNQKYFISFN